MKAYDVYTKAVLRLGYNGSVNNRLLERAPELINQIAMDLKIEPISTLGDEIKADQTVVEALCCGTAMLLALSEGDGDKHKLFCEIYNGKRAAVLSETVFVEDKLPVAEGGEMNEVFFL